MTDNIWSGSKIRLRPVRPSDWEWFHENDQDSECARLCDAIYFPRSEQGTKSWAEHKAFVENENDNVFLAIETLDGILVGSICTNSCDIRNGIFKYGLAIFRKHQRKGFASEAIRILLNYYFEELRYHKVNTEVYSFNDASIALHERLGFIREGALREVHFSYGKYYDSYIYGMTKNEFEKIYLLHN